MSNSSPHTTLRGSSPFPTSNKENARQPTSGKPTGSAAKTPSKSRVNLGAPANFYFKYMNSSSKKAASSTSFLDEDSLDADNMTGTISIPGLNKSINTADNSLISLGASSSGSSSQSDADMLNKSTLSDTTDLTASSFVLQATSRQVMHRLATEARSAKKQRTEQDAAKKDDLRPTVLESDAKPMTVNAVLANEPERSTGQSTILLSQDTPTADASTLRRQSLRGASPSLRQRMSASPQSLKKLTEDLRNQRMTRLAKQDAKNRLSIDSKNSIQSLNAQLELLNSNNDPMDTVNLDRKRLPPAFFQPPKATAEIMEAAGSSASMNHKSIATQESMSPKNGDLKPLKSDERNSENGSSTVPETIEVSNHTADSILELSVRPSDDSEAAKVGPPASPSSPMTEASAPMSSRRTPGLTPTKLKSPARRVLNRMVLDSPARNTRSSTKKNKVSGQVEQQKTFALANADDVPGDDTATPRTTVQDIEALTVEQGGGDTASLGDLSGVFLGTLSQDEMDSTSNNPSANTEMNGNPEQIDEERSFALANTDDVSGEDIASHEKSLQDIEASTTEQGGGDTASLGDLSGAFVGSLSQDKMDSTSNNPLANTEMNGNPEQIDEERSFALANTDDVSGEDIALHEKSLQDIEASTTEQGGGDTASLGDLSGAFVGSLSQDEMDSTSNNPPANTEMNGNPEQIDEERSFALANTDDVSGEDIASHEKSLQDIDVSTTEQGGGDTASLGDLSGVFVARQAHAEGSCSATLSIEPTILRQEDVQMVDGETVSLADVSGILGSQSQKASPVTDTIGSPSGEDKMEIDQGRDLEDEKGAPLSCFSVKLQVAETHSQGAVDVLPQLTAEGPTQSNADSTCIDYISVECKSGQLQGQETLSATERCPLSDNESGGPTTPREDSNYGANELSFGSALSSKMSMTETGGGDTASLADIADILGTGSSEMEVDSPRSLQSSDGNAPAYQRIKTQMSQDSNGSALKSEIGNEDDPETASLSDLAEILGSTSTQTQEGSPTSKSCIALSPSQATNEDTRSKSPADNDDMQLQSSGGTDATFSPSSQNTWSSGGVTSKSPAATGTAPTRSPIRLTPNSHVKPTPTKIAPSPRRIVNPLHPNSPARNTRNAKKATLQGGISDDPSSEAVSSSSKRRLSETSTTRDGEEIVPEKHSFDLDVGFAKSKRRKSSSQGLALATSAKENNSQASPMPRRTVPVGILSSRKKVQSTAKSTRSVAFGSPEAAEYHIGSPSVNMTPMPSNKAKALFSIPRGNLSVEDSETSDCGEHTVEIEADLNVLVDKITVENMKGSPQLSPISNARDDTGPVVLPGNYQLTKEKANISIVSSKTSSIEELTLNSREQGEMTVELEGGMERLLANMYSHADESPSSRPDNNLSKLKQPKESLGSSQLSPADSSVEMTDAQSIASVNSAKADKFTSKLQLDAQKLDFSLQRPESLSAMDDNDESMDIDEGATVELENGMTGVLVAAAVRDSVTSGQDLSSPDNQSAADREQQPVLKKEASQVNGVPAEQLEHPTIEFDDMSSIATNRSRRSSLASHRFTLDTDDRVHVSTDGSIVDPESYLVEEHSVSFRSPEVSEMREAPFFSREPISLTLDEVLKFCNKPLEVPEFGGNSDTVDVLVKFNVSCQNAKDPVPGKWKQVLQAVCGEVERRTESGTGEALASVFASDSERFVQLQGKLRSDDNSQIRKRLGLLVDESRKVISSEWNTWLVTVIESFGNPLHEVSNGIDRDVGTLDELVRNLHSIQEQIRMLNDRKVRKARRMSLGRRKNTCADLKSEIQQLEKMIAKTESAFAESSAKEYDCDRILTSAEEADSYRKEFDAIQSQAKSAQKGYTSLRGLHSWMPLEVAESSLSFDTIGNSVNTCTTVTYDIFKQKGSVGNVQKKAQIPDGMKKSLRKYSGSVAMFLDDSVRRLAESARGNKNSWASSALTKNMQNYVWTLGRLDFTAGEIQGLLSRYKCALCRTGASSFVLTVDFEGRASKLSVEFGMEFCYPSLPLEVRMDVWEGEIDFEGIRKALVKNAKPGFGYLSRACDIVNAYVK